MNDRHLLKGLFLIGIALAFGLGAMRYPMGSLGRAGPGLFPFLVSSVLFLLGAAMIVRSRLQERKAMYFNVKNIAVILGSLAGFALLSEYINMIVGIVFLVFCATIAGTSYSITRNIKVAIGLVAIAVAFQKLLGLQLPLY
ncbi:MAG TPA: tripartite tricarboxylate transporter TctB family protein [Casimicrobiaceae bacterium]|nr:tripartite tricarboxylate transporter TctB family protein [Casimicrobiaceae bacterium]